MALPATRRVRLGKNPANGQNGQRRPAPPDSRSVLTEPVKLRLTLSTARATSIPSPSRRPAPAPKNRARNHAPRSRARLPLPPSSVEH